MIRRTPPHKRSHGLRSPYWVLLLLAVLVAIASASCHRTSSLQFTVRFDNAKGLKEGQFVIYRGLPIGEVSSVDLDKSGGVDVRLTIDPKYRKQVYREASFIIEKRGGMLDISGEKQVTMKDTSGPHTRVQPGDVIQGSDSMLDLFLKKAQAVAGEFLQNGSKAASSLMETLKELSSSPQAQALLKDLEDYSNTLATKAGKSLGKLSDQQLQILKEKAEGLKESLENSGKTDQAKQFWLQFLNWLSTHASAQQSTPPKQSSK